MPEHAIALMTQYMTQFNAQIPTTATDDRGRRVRTPASLRSWSWAIELASYAAREWGQYEVVEQHQEEEGI